MNTTLQEVNTYKEEIKLNYSDTVSGIKTLRLKIFSNRNIFQNKFKLLNNISYSLIVNKDAKEYNEYYNISNKNHIINADYKNDNVLNLNKETFIINENKENRLNNSYDLNYIDPNENIYYDNEFIDYDNEIYNLDHEHKNNSNQNKITVVKPIDITKDFINKFKDCYFACPAASIKCTSIHTYINCFGVKYLAYSYLNSSDKLFYVVFLNLQTSCEDFKRQISITTSESNNHYISSFNIENQYSSYILFSDGIKDFLFLDSYDEFNGFYITNVGQENYKSRGTSFLTSSKNTISIATYQKYDEPTLIDYTYLSKNDAIKFYKYLSSLANIVNYYDNYTNNQYLLFCGNSLVLFNNEIMKNEKEYNSSAIGFNLINNAKVITNFQGERKVLVNTVESLIIFDFQTCVNESIYDFSKLSNCCNLHYFWDGKVALFNSTNIIKILDIEKNRNQIAELTVTNEINSKVFLEMSIIIENTNSDTFGVYLINNKMGIDYFSLNLTRFVN